MYTAHTNINLEFDRMLTSPPRQEASLLLAEYYLPKDFAPFTGHFPDFPIMPALMQVLLGQHLLTSLLQKKFKLREIPVAKFTAQSLPDERLNVQAKLLSEDATNPQMQIWEFSIKKTNPPEIAVANFRLVLEVEE